MISPSLEAKVCFEITTWIFFATEQEQEQLIKIDQARYWLENQLSIVIVYVN